MKRAAHVARDLLHPVIVLLLNYFVLSWTSVVVYIVEICKLEMSVVKYEKHTEGLHAVIMHAVMITGLSFALSNSFKCRE